MLSQLYIQNYVLIDQVELRFNKGFNVITGETGAGKSILLGALNLILGKRVDTSVLINTSKKCIIEATFNIKNYTLEQLFEVNDIDFDVNTIIRREITSSGKSRAFVNDTPVNLSTLKTITSQLVDMHQQQETFNKLLSEAFLINLLDKMADNSTLLSNYHLAFKELKEINTKIIKIEEEIKTNQQATDYNQFLLDEFSKLNLSIEDDKDIEEQLKLLTHAEDIKAGIHQAISVIENGEYAIENQLREIIRLISPLSTLNEGINTNLVRTESLLVELQDIQNELSSISDQTHLDNDRIAYLQERSSQINRLYQKHQVSTVEDLISVQNTLESKFKTSDELQVQLETLKRKQETIKEKCYQLATTLSQRRTKNFTSIKEKVNETLKVIGMPYAQINISKEERNSLNNFGIDNIELLFSPNKGAAFSTLQKVGSGGEKSRLMLAFQSLIASSMVLPTMIFDEIDTGISGEIALKVGDLLKKMAASHQIISISHLPQIAAKADEHFFVHKNQEKEKASTSIKLLNKKERLQEIATMLSGKNPGKAAIKNAEELITYN